MEDNEQFEEIFDDVRPQEEETESEDLSLEVEEEIEEEEPSVEVPKKFQGKSLEDVIEAYTNLEKEFGRKSNEVGELRKLSDQLLELKLTDTKKAEPEEWDVDVDTLLENPKQALTRAVEDNPRLKALEEKFLEQDRKAQQAMFEAKHPDFQDIGNSPEFMEWAQSSPTRLKLLTQAHNSYDYDLADELLTMYKEVQGIKVKEAKEMRKSVSKDKLKKAGGVQGGGDKPTQKVYRRADLIRLRVERPQEYEARSAEFMSAYAEGRVK